MTEEPALFALIVQTKIRNQIDQIMSSPPDLPIQANNNTTFLIVTILKYLKVNFSWQCVNPPLAPNRDQVCTDYELMLDTP